MQPAGREPRTSGFAHIRLEGLMHRSLLLTLAFITGIGVTEVNAQSATPRVELGIDLSKITDTDRGATRWGPRLIGNFSDRNSMEFSSTFQRRSECNGCGFESDLYLVNFRRLIHAEGTARVFATFGSGIERQVLVLPEYTYVLPEYTYGSNPPV